MNLGAPLNSSSAGSLASDTRGIDALRASAARDPKAAVQEAAKQFESLFMQQLMKSMRQATLSSGMLDNSGTQMGTEMLDTQLATKMTGLPGGLSAAIARQLERQMGLPAHSTDPAGGATPMPTLRPTATPWPAAALPGPSAASAPKGASASTNFVREQSAAAKAAERETGIPASFMIAQAAHETGWGRQQIKNADGTSANNLFGIKATSAWKGAVAEVKTTEYIDGQARKVVAKFRAYASAEDSFRDYARMMKNSPRYAAVVAQVSGAQADSASAASHFASGLQRAGYATDPAYAQKLAGMINTTLRLQRAMG